MLQNDFEMVFGILVSRFGIFWRHIRPRLKKTAKIIGVASKIQNYTIENAGNDEFE